MKNLQILALIVCTAFAVPRVAGQISLSDISEVEGPWECRSPSGISGVHISAFTSLTEKDGRQEIAGQAIHIRVYQRRGAEETRGYFSTADSGGVAVFDGKRLAIHFKDRAEIPPFDLDVRFDASARRWIGVWSLCANSHRAILDRPHANQDAATGKFIGDWKGYADPASRFRSAPGTLHIRSSYDGAMIAWLDRAISGTDPRSQITGTDQRNGEELEVRSVAENIILLKSSNPNGAGYQYKGALGSDGKDIKGKWLNQGAGRLNAPPFYRRIEP